MGLRSWRVLTGFSDVRTAQAAALHHPEAMWSFGVTRAGGAAPKMVAPAPRLRKAVRRETDGDNGAGRSLCSELPPRHDKGDMGGSVATHHASRPVRSLRALFLVG